MKEYEIVAKFCNACGKPLEAPVKAPKARKQRPWGLIAIIAVLCVALIGGGFFAVKTFTEFRDRQQELENQLADRDREDKRTKKTTTGPRPTRNPTNPLRTPPFPMHLPWRNPP